MIELERALAILRNVPAGALVETIPLDDALGRVLARDVLSPIDSPPFDKSAMDGFAVRDADDSLQFTIVDTVAAGGVPARTIGRGECARIMTGAMLPPGTGRVIRKEYVREETGSIRVHTPEQGDNVIRKGASLRAGQPVLRPGVIGPQDVGALAGSGIDRVTVAVPPRTAILCTGRKSSPPALTWAPARSMTATAPSFAPSSPRCAAPAAHERAWKISRLPLPRRSKNPSPCATC